MSLRLALADGPCDRLGGLISDP